MRRRSNIPPMGGIPPSVRRGKPPIRSEVGLGHIASDLQRAVIKPEISFGFRTREVPRDDGLGSTAKPFRVCGGKRKEGASREPPLEPYSLNSWATEEAFIVHIEGISDSSKVSFSLRGDILEVRDLREGVSPANSLQEIVITEEFEPRMDPLLRKYWKDLRVVEIRFVKKDRSS